MEFGGSDSKGSSSNSDPAVQEKYAGALIDWTAKTPVEKKLVLGVLHRSGHKNFEEANDAMIAKSRAHRVSQRKISQSSIATIKSRKKSVLSIAQQSSSKNK